MTAERLLLATDLDRTLLPNGAAPESPGARDVFRRLAAHPAVTLVYVSGRDLSLVEEAMDEYTLPAPDHIVADVGTSLYRRHGGEWIPDAAWWAEIAQDWRHHSHADVAARLQPLTELRPQEPAKQNRYKLSYYLPLESDTTVLSAAIQARLRPAGVAARLVFSIDEPNAVGLLDVLPARASKLHALEFLLATMGRTPADAVFAGDSGNDLEVLASPLPAVLVANATEAVRQEARRRCERAGTAAALYCARGGFLAMNGNYAAGIVEGVAHFRPEYERWLRDESATAQGGALEANR